MGRCSRAIEVEGIQEEGEGAGGEVALEKLVREEESCVRHLLGRRKHHFVQLSTVDRHQMLHT